MALSDRNRETRIRELIAEFTTRRAEGQPVDSAAWSVEYAELMPELLERWQMARLVATAQARLDEPISRGGRETVVDEGCGTMGDAVEGAVRVACPLCCCSISLAADASFEQITCTGCGHQFAVWDPNHEAQRFSAGRCVGRFELLESLGRGGFGTVWKARDPHLDRCVALKIPRGSDLTPAEAELFLREARAAAQVRHPNIVSLHEVGRDGDTIFLVSDLINGPPLNVWLVNRRVTHVQAAELCHTIAGALAAVHAAGIVHRDLKPGNILLDGQNRPYLTDFGLARRTAGEMTLTLDGQVLGTPAYMAPEQARGQSHGTDGRGDLYSLGAILFELLVGVPPFQGAAHAVLEQVLRDEPPRLRKLDRAIPRDLETICLRCLEKDPARRFATATDLADDLARFLRGEPVASRPLGCTRRVLRWVRRKPLQATLAIGLILLATCGPLLAARERWLSQVATVAKEDALHQRNVAESRARELQAMTRAAQRERDLAEQAREQTELARARAVELERRSQRLHYCASMQLVQRAVDERDMLLAEDLLLQHLPDAADATSVDLRGFEWHYYWNVCHCAARGAVSTQGMLGRLWLTPDDNQLLVLANSDLVQVDWQQQRALARFPAEATQTVGLCFGSQGRLFALDLSGELRWWDRWPGSSTGSLIAHQGAARGLVRISGQSQFVSFGDDGQILVWSDEPTQPLQQLRLPDQLACRAVAVAPDGKSLVAMGRRRIDVGQDLSVGTFSSLVKFDLVSGEERWRISLGPHDASAVAISPDGQIVATLAGSSSPSLWEVSTGKLLRRCEPRPESFSWVGFSPDGRWLAAFARGGSNLSFWQVTDGQLTDFAISHRGLTDAVWRADGTLLTCGKDAHVRGWQAGDVSYRRPLGPRLGPPLTGAQFAADQQAVLTESRWRICQLWDLRTERLRHIFPGLHRDVLLLPDHATLLSRTPDTVYRQSSDRLRAETIYRHLRADRKINALAVSPDGVRLAVGESSTRAQADQDDVEIVVWNLAEDRAECRLAAGKMAVNRLAFMPDGRTLISVDYHAVRLWDIPRGELRHELEIPGFGMIGGLACRPDGQQFAAANIAGLVYVWDLAPLRQRFSFTCHDNRVNDLTFSPDSRTLIAAVGEVSYPETRQGEVQFWDLPTGQPTVRLTDPTGVPVGVAMLPDQRQLCIAFADGRLQLLDARPRTNGGPH